MEQHLGCPTHGRVDTSIFLMSLLNAARQNQNYSPLANAIINIIGDNKYREYLPFKGNDLSWQKRVKLTLLCLELLNALQTSGKLQVNDCHGRRMSTIGMTAEITIISLLVRVRGSSATGISLNSHLHYRFLPTFNQKASSDRWMHSVVEAESECVFFFRFRKVTCVTKPLRQL